MTIDFETKTDGRWMAEVLEIPGFRIYGKTRDEAARRVQDFALQIVACDLGLTARDDLPGVLFRVALSIPTHRLHIVPDT